METQPATPAAANQPTGRPPRPAQTNAAATSTISASRTSRAQYVSRSGDGSLSGWPNVSARLQPTTPTHTTATASGRSMRRRQPGLGSAVHP
jgi:hypothetical protein